MFFLSFFSFLFFSFLFFSFLPFSIVSCTLGGKFSSLLLSWWCIGAQSTGPTEWDQNNSIRLAEISFQAVCRPLSTAFASVRITQCPGTADWQLSASFRWSSSLHSIFPGSSGRFPLRLCGFHITLLPLVCLGEFIRVYTYVKVSMLLHYADCWNSPRGATGG